MRVSCYSQTTYPKELIIDGDTVVAITLDNCREINQVFLDAKHYKIVSDSLNQKVILLNGRIDNDSIIIGDQNFQIDNFETIMYNKQLVTDRLEQDLKDTDNELTRSKKGSELVKKAAIGSIGLNVLLLLAMMLNR